MKHTSTTQKEEGCDNTQSSNTFYAIKILSLPPTIQLDSLILKFLKSENLNNDEIQLIKSSNDSEINHNFIEFFNSNSNLKKFLSFFEKIVKSKLDYELIDDELVLNSQLPGHLFIRGLLYTTTAQDLYNIFKPFGEIKACKIVFNDYGISKGFGFLNFSNKIEADNAIQNLNGCNVDGNVLFINHHISKKDRLRQLESKLNKYSNILIRNLPPDITKEKLQNVFSKFGKINSIFLNDDLNNDNNKNNADDEHFAFINFKYHEDAIAARNEMNEYEIQPGYNIQINRAERKKERIQYENLAHHFNIITNNAKSTEEDPLNDITENTSANKLSDQRRQQQLPNHLGYYDDFRTPMVDHRTYSFSSNSSSRSLRRASSLASPSVLPTFTMMQNNVNFESHTNMSNINNNNMYQTNRQLQIPKGSNQRLQYPQAYQPIIPFTYNEKNKSQELLLQPEKQFPQHSNSTIHLEQPQKFQPPITTPSPTVRSMSMQDPIIPPFIVTPDSNLISTTTGLPIAGPQFQDSNLYVIHLPKEYNDNDLYTLFEKYGKITSSKVITYQPEEIEQLKRQNELNIPQIGESKCFGFVCFQNPIDASKALVCMNGFEIDSNHILKVSFAQRKENKYNHGKLHHHNQNHLGGLYQYLNSYNHYNYNYNTYGYGYGNSVPPNMGPMGPGIPMESTMNNTNNMQIFSGQNMIAPQPVQQSQFNNRQQHPLSPQLPPPPPPPPQQQQQPQSTAPNLMYGMNRVPSVHGYVNYNPAVSGIGMIDPTMGHYQSPDPISFIHPQSTIGSSTEGSVRMSTMSMQFQRPPQPMDIPGYNNWYYPNGYYPTSEDYYEDEDEDEFYGDTAGMLNEVENNMNDLIIGVSEDDEDEGEEEDDERESEDDKVVIKNDDNVVKNGGDSSMDNNKDNANNDTIKDINENTTKLLRPNRRYSNHSSHSNHSNHSNRSNRSIRLRINNNNYTPHGRRNYSYGNMNDHNYSGNNQQDYGYIYRQPESGLSQYHNRVRN